MKWDFRCKSKYEIHEYKTIKNTNEKIKLRLKKWKLREMIERKKKKKKGKKRKEKERKEKKDTNKVNEGKSMENKVVIYNNSI